MPRNPSTPSTESLVVTEVIADLPVLRDATTSRVLLNNDVLRVVLFSMDTGQLLTEHSSPKAVVVELLDGKMDFTVAGESSILAPGDVVYLAPGERHALVALEPSHMSLTLVHVDKAGRPRKD